MMSTFFKKTVTFCFAALVVLGLANASAFASILDYQAAVQTDTNAIVQYSFDGETAAEQQYNGMGNASYDLTKITEIAGEEIIFANGFDDSSNAFTPYPPTGGSTGNAFTTTNTIPLNTTGASYEIIFSPTSSNSNNQTTYVVGSYTGNNDRSYLTTIYSSNGSDHFRGRVSGGSDFPLAENISTGDWYYLAMTMSYDGAYSTFNTYIANLSDENPTLTQTVSNGQVTGSFVPNAAYGIGMLHYEGFSDPYQSFFKGSIDEIVLYDGIKSFEDFDANLGLILQTANVPEPGCVALILTGLLLFIPVTKRRFR